MQERIRRIRTDAHLTQAEFAEALGFAPTSSAAWEKKVKPQIPTPPTRELICAKFHVNKHWLETGEGEPYADNGDSIFTGQLAEAYSEGGVFKAFADVYLSMTDAQKAVIDEMIERFYTAYQDAKTNGTELDLMDVSIQTAALMDGLTEPDTEEQA